MKPGPTRDCPRCGGYRTTRTLYVRVGPPDLPRRTWLPVGFICDLKACRSVTLFTELGGGLKSQRRLK